jgi:Asp-tRNA(Asn)/Glu-tRNA(Gln) amidotransferase A subunit family amidase
MQEQELVTKPAAEMAELVRSKKVSPIELIDAHLARIEELQPRLNAFVTIDWEGARRQARAAESAVMHGEPLGTLHGVPVSIKSSIAVAGLPCEAGSCLKKGAIAKQDAVVVARLKKAGAIVLGTTNLPEMLMAYESDNPLCGRTNNPWELERTAGGSSGGESAAVAACCSAGGIGSDSGGSIRIPAHFTGICGLKATPGRIPGTGHDPECLGPFSLLGAVGPMTRTIGDLELFYEATAGADSGDVMADPVPIERASQAQLRQLRVGYFEQEDDVPATAETRQAVRDAAQALTAQGFEVVPFRLKNLREVRRVWWTFFTLGGAMLLKQMYAGRECEMGWLLTEFMQMASSEPALTGEKLMEAWLRRDQLRTQMLEQMQDVPVFISPVCSIPAFRHRERSWVINGRSVEYFDVMSYTQWFNVLGNPCVVAPVGQTISGLPIGVQVVARPWQEHIAVGVARCIEQDFGWKQPPIAASAATPAATA